MMPPVVPHDCKLIRAAGLSVEPVEASPRQCFACGEFTRKAVHYQWGELEGMAWGCDGHKCRRWLRSYLHCD